MENDFDYREMALRTMGHNDLQEFNLANKQKRLDCPEWTGEDDIRMFLEHNSKIRAVVVCFSDIEGRFHMLDYDKEFLLTHSDNLTFDGSSIRGFTAQHESDLRIELDWCSTYILPPEVCADGKALIFGYIHDQVGNSYSGDIRSVLAGYLRNLRQQGIRVNIGAEIEGFLFKDINVERDYSEENIFEPITTGGYFNTLPASPLRIFIDLAAQVQRMVGFENEKDHPEVAPSQFELNWKYTEALIAADQIQLYKMICRQIAATMKYTACFLPKPLMGINGNGMHFNISLEQDGRNLFFGDGKNNLSGVAWDFINGILNNAEDICLALNSSVNAYRRLDPQYEAPNEIKASDSDRGAMIRIPTGNEQSARIEIRTVAPDANPYLAILAVLHAGLSLSEKNEERYAPTDFPAARNYDKLPADIYTAIQYFKKSDLIKKMLGSDVKAKYTKWKEAAADRCPRLLGTAIKVGEVIYHHDITNQQLWSMF